MPINKFVLMSGLGGNGMADRNSRYSKIPVNHIPMMITDNGKILCIPKSSEMTHVAFTAMTSKGKGIGGANLLGYEHYLCKELCMILNDFQSETHESSLACSNRIFNQNLKIINSNPLGLPMVYVYPSNADLKIDETQSKFPHIIMTLPTKMIIKNIEYFYKLEKAGKYITASRERFEECGDINDIINLLDELIPTTGRERQMESMKIKIRAIFENVFNEKLTNSSSPERPDKLLIKKHGKEIYGPNSEDENMGLSLQSLMSAGFIPSIQTSEIRGKQWFSAYMAMIVESIYKAKYDDPFFKNRNLVMYVPEIDKMWKGENSDKGSKIKEKLSLIGTNGRRAGIRLVWDAQDYGSVPDAIRANTKTIFVGRKANAEEVRDIKKDWNISKELESAILSLESSPERGRFEFVAITADKFALYDLKDGKLTWTTEAQKGMLITPMSQNKQPGKPLIEVISHKETIPHIKELKAELSPLGVIQKKIIGNRAPRTPAQIESARKLMQAINEKKWAKPPISIPN